jgi:hypothetical protein
MKLGLCRDISLFGQAIGYGCSEPLISIESEEYGSTGQASIEKFSSQEGFSVPGSTKGVRKCIIFLDTTMIFFNTRWLRSLFPIEFDAFFV